MKVVAHQIRIQSNEVLPIRGRAAWIDRHGVLEPGLAVSLRASLAAWEDFGATINGDGSIALKDMVLTRQLQILLCGELRREPKSLSRDEDETEALLHAARFGAICELSPLPKDSFPQVGAPYDSSTTPWFAPGDPRVPWSKSGQEYQYGLRLVYDETDNDNGECMPNLIRIDGPFHLDQFEALPPVAIGQHGRLLVRSVGKD